MSHNFLFLLVICSLFWNVQVQSAEGENSTQIATKGSSIRTRRGVTAVPKFIVQMISRLVRNIFQNLKNLLQRFEKYAISMLSDTLSFLARSDNTAITRKRRSPELDDSDQAGRNGGGVISTVSKLFMTPFKLAFGAVKWVPGAVLKSTAKIGVTVAGDVMESSVFRSLAHAAVATGEKVAEESWNFAKVNLFPRMDKWATSARESHSLPDSVSTFLAEMQTLYHIYRFLGLA